MEKKFTEKESLNVIMGMIENAKTNVQSGLGYHFLLWGYLVILAGLNNFIFFGKLWQYYGWTLMLPIGFIGSFIIGWRNARKTRFYTYTDRIVGGTWIAFAVGMAIMFSAYPILRSLGDVSGEYIAGAYYMFYPILLLIAAAGLFVSGMAYRFKPLKFGAMICWACAIGCFFTPMRYDILLYIIAFVFGYIIPGHILICKDSKANKNV